MASRALTPTLIICLAGAVAGGIALTRPASTPATATATATTATTAGGSPAAVAPDHGAASGYGRRPATTAARSAGGQTGRASAGAGAATITISSFSFGSPVTVAPGARVTVRNNDSASHTVTGRTFDTGTIAGGGSATFTAPTEPGTYPFSCEIHPSMTSSLIVR